MQIAMLIVILLSVVRLFGAPSNLNLPTETGLFYQPSADTRPPIYEKNVKEIRRVFLQTDIPKQCLSAEYAAAFVLFSKETLDALVSLKGTPNAPMTEIVQAKAALSLMTNEQDRFGCDIVRLNSDYLALEEQKLKHSSKGPSDIWEKLHDYDELNKLLLGFVEQGLVTVYDKRMNRLTKSVLVSYFSSNDQPLCKGGVGKIQVVFPYGQTILSDQWTSLDNHPSCLSLGN